MGQPVPRNLPRLTSLRWYAALLVFGYHLGGSVFWRPLRLLSFGQTGVAFFFVLSGFVLAWSFRAEGSIRRVGPASTSAVERAWGSALDFYRRRFARIYPSMVVMTLVALVISQSWPRFGDVGGALGLITTFLLIQAWFPGSYPVYSYDSVCWSLSVEAFCYVLMPWLIGPLGRLRPRTRALIAGAVLLAALAATLLLVDRGHGNDIAFNNPLIRFPEFVLGMVLALAMRDGWRTRFPLWLAVAITVAAGLVARRVGHFPLEDYVLILPFALLIVSAASRDAASTPGWLRRRWAVYLGEVSFCFYLVHQIVIHVLLVAFGWGHSWSATGGIGVVVATLGLSLLGAIVLHHVVERPLQRLLLQRRRPEAVRTRSALPRHRAEPTGEQV